MFKCNVCGSAYWSGLPTCLCKALPVDGQPETVNHPSHYGGPDNPYEVIKVIDAWEANFCLGNAIKYIARAGKKGDYIEDLKKAIWYLEHECQRMKK